MEDGRMEAKLRITYNSFPLGSIFFLSRKKENCLLDLRMAFSSDVSNYVFALPPYLNFLRRLRLVLVMIGFSYSVFQMIFHNWILL